MNRLVWFRNDLRLHDNETLTAAVEGRPTGVHYVFIYETAWDQLTPEGHPRLGRFKKAYLAQSFLELRRKLRGLGADLIGLTGDPVEILPRLCAELRINEVYHSLLPTHDERKQESAITKTLAERDITCFGFHTRTLIHPGDHAGLSDSKPIGYSKFRKMVEIAWAIRPPLPAIKEAPPSSAQTSPAHAWIPEDLLSDVPTERGYSVLGGEDGALARVRAYFWERDRLRVYKETRNGLLEIDDSSKFSAALAMGCVSARHLYAEVRRYEGERTRNGSTLWFLYELLWRDYFHFSALRRGRDLFTEMWPAEGAPKSDKQRTRSFEYWREGQTGRPFIDAAMNELRLTGWMSNRMRQNTASFLVHELNGDWRAGARWFETCLVDYDAASNWGNWSYVTGTGPNAPHRFDVDQQAAFYDPDGSYADYWAGS